MNGTGYLISFGLLWTGGSIGGIETAVLRDVLLGGTNEAERRVVDDLPADVERTDGVSSIMFRPN